MATHHNPLLQRTNNLLTPLLLLLLVALGGWLGQHYSQVWDWSSDGRNTLSTASLKLLGQLQAPLHITSFSPESPRLREATREIVARYQRVRPDITLEFVNPDAEPQRIRELGVQLSGELRLEYQQRTEHLRTIDEESISNAIQRLIQRPEQWISVLAGHGERRIDGSANHDLGAFGNELRRKGFQLQPLDLATSPTIPDNSRLLIIAGPRTRLLPGELTQIKTYLQRGGNLLWLIDPGPQQGLERLADELGISILPGVIVDINAAALQLTSPANALIPSYPEHPATRGFRQITLFPHAAALEVVESTSSWQATPLLRTLERTWNETGAIEGDIQQDPEQQEQAGPLTLGIALTRQQEKHKQRVLVIGDGDFISNSHLGNGGNLQLGLNLVRWLTGNEALLNIPARTASDQQLQLSENTGLQIGFVFLIVLPLLLLGCGLFFWWHRRKL